MKILVVGGAGYIGSHMVKDLGLRGFRVTTLDNLSAGYRDAVLYGDFVRGDISDRQFLFDLINGGQFDAVMHFASHIQVGESMKNPGKYYQNNVSGTLNLLDAMVAAGVKKLVFSSTAAIYGIPIMQLIDEEHPKAPINPYGKSKLMVEMLLKDYDVAYGIKSVSLRYFNACGADPDGELGERHEPETHLIPVALQAASGRRSDVTVFGSDYDTPDGTCIRDYVHVSDLCQAHWLALDRLLNGYESQAFNLGNGEGFSVRQVLSTIYAVTGVAIRVIDAPRRPGDPAILVANSAAAVRDLGWKPRYSDLDQIVSHAWAWENRMAGNATKR